VGHRQAQGGSWGRNDRVEQMQPPPALPVCIEHVCVFEQAQVLDDCEQRHPLAGLELDQRASIALEWPLEQKSTGWVGRAVNARSSSFTVRGTGHQMVTLARFST
jgi:hypothetical protein